MTTARGPYLSTCRICMSLRRVPWVTDGSSLTSEPHGRAPGRLPSGPALRLGWHTFDRIGPPCQAAIGLGPLGCQRHGWVPAGTSRERATYWAPWIPAAFNWASRVALNSVPGFHCGYLSAWATL